MDARYFLGIDAGGTSTKARLTDATGAVLGAAQTGSGSLRHGAESAFTAIVDVATAAYASADISLEAQANTRCAVGIAGVSLTAAYDALRAKSFPFAALRFASDAEIACIGAHAGGDGGIVIAGTGSIGIAKIGEMTHRIGGFGFPISDEGSGAEIGFRAIRAYCQMRDGRLPPGPLADKLAPVLEKEGIAYWRDEARPSEFARLAEEVFAAAAEGDVIARVIVENAGKEISKIAQALVRAGATRWCLMGGLAPLMKAVLSADAERTRVEPEGDAIDGALWLAGLRA